MEDSTLWWLVAGLLIAAELITGTFYLLMLALGAAAGAIAAHAGAGMIAQLIAAAVVGGGASAAWHLRQQRGKATDGQPGADAGALLDVGQTVEVSAWLSDGSAQVHYRGAQWLARMAPGASGAPLTPGPHRISGVQGSQLLLEKI